MHADPAPNGDSFTLSQEESDTLSELEAAGMHQVAHSLLSVLLPAQPPEPKNARVIRLFDYEAAKNDPKPGVEAPAATAAPKVKPDSKSREAAKAARNQSLLAAARLI